MTELPPEAKKARLLELHMLATNRPGAAASAYPDTDAQYGSGAGADPAAAYPDTDGQYAAAADVAPYPDTDAQYAGAGTSGGGGAAAGQAPEYSGWYGGGYSHEYQGWDAYHYQQAAAGGQASPPDPDGGAGGSDPAGDDINRYLPPGARFEAASPLVRPEGQEAEAEEGADAAQEALGLIGGYGTSSDEDGGGAA